MLRHHRIWTFLRRNDAESTAEGNTNRGAWWIAAIVIFVLIAGVGWYLIGNMLSDAQTGTNSAITSLSTQSGLNALAGKVESNQSGIGTSAPTGGFTAP